jgi:hypothetical protein
LQLECLGGVDLDSPLHYEIEFVTVIPIPAHPLLLSVASVLELLAEFSDELSTLKAAISVALADGRTMQVLEVGALLKVDGQPPDVISRPERFLG